jgi:hypothetical protein
MVQPQLAPLTAAERKAQEEQVRLLKVAEEYNLSPETPARDQVEQLVNMLDDADDITRFDTTERLDLIRTVVYFVKGTIVDDRELADLPFLFSNLNSVQKLAALDQYIPEE